MLVRIKDAAQSSPCSRPEERALCVAPGCLRRFAVALRPSLTRPARDEGWKVSGRGVSFSFNPSPPARVEQDVSW